MDLSVQKADDEREENKESLSFIKEKPDEENRFHNDKNIYGELRTLRTRLSKKNAYKQNSIDIKIPYLGEG